MGFGGPVIKEGVILVISIVTLPNYFGDLGEVCGKYPGWVKAVSKTSRADVGSCSNLY